MGQRQQQLTQIAGFPGFRVEGSWFEDPRGDHPTHAAGQLHVPAPAGGEASVGAPLREMLRGLPEPRRGDDRRAPVV